MTAGVVLRTAARRVTRALSGGRSARGFRRGFGSAGAPLGTLARAARWLAAIGDVRPRLLEGPLWGRRLAALTAARPFAEEGTDGSRAHRDGPRPRSREPREPGAISAAASRLCRGIDVLAPTGRRVSRSGTVRPAPWASGAAGGSAAGTDRHATRAAAPSPQSLDRHAKRSTLTRLVGSSVPVANGPAAEPRRRRTRSLPAPSDSGPGGSPRPGTAPRSSRKGATSWRRSVEERSRRRLAAAVPGERATRGPTPDFSASDDSACREPVWSAPFTGTEVRTEILLRLAEPNASAPAARMPDGGRSARGGGARGTDRESAHAATPAGAHSEGSSSAERTRELSGGGPPSQDGKAHSGEPPAGTSSRVPLSTWPWNREAASASTEDRRLDPDLSPELPRQTAEGPEAAAGEGEAPRLFDRSPAEPREDDLERLARGLERLLGDEARRFGIDV